MPGKKLKITRPDRPASTMTVREYMAMHITCSLIGAGNAFSGTLKERIKHGVDWADVLIASLNEGRLPKKEQQPST